MLPQKLLALLLSLCLLSLLATGCGGDSPEVEEEEESSFSVILSAEDADLTYGPDIILEGSDDAPNLGGWLYGNEACWVVDLPYDGLYDFWVLYSMPGNFEPAFGCLDTYSEKGDCYGAGTTFCPTSEGEYDWTEYAYTNMTLDLPAGETLVTLYPGTLPGTQEHFINLRQVEVEYVGAGGDIPVDPNSGEDEPIADRSAGWWVRPTGYVSEGISLVDCFQLNEEDMTWTVYNTYGEAGSTLDYTLDGDTLSMDFQLDTADFILADGQLLDPESGQVEFVFVTEDPFMAPDIDLDGRWYLNGAMDGPYYEISGKNYKRVVPVDGEETVEFESTFSMQKIQQYYNDHLVPNVFKLEGEHFNPTLVPDPTGTVLVTEDGFDYTVYAREDALTGEMGDTFEHLGTLLEGELTAEPVGEITQTLEFMSYCFNIYSFAPDEDGWLSPTGECWIGRWSVTGPDTLTLEFDDGTTEEIDISLAGDKVRVETVQNTFFLPGF